MNIYIWPYMADEKKYIYIYMYTQKLGKISFPTLPPRKKRSTVCFSLLVPPVSASTVGSPYLTLICFFGHDGWIHIPLIDGDFLMVMFIPRRLKIINRLFSRVCFYFHLCPVITLKSHSGRPSPKKTKSHLTFHKHQPNFTSQKIEQKQPKILPSSTCSAVPICQKFWFNQPTQQSQHQTSPALKQKSPTSRSVTFFTVTHYKPHGHHLH